MASVDFGEGLDADIVIRQVLAMARKPLISTDSQIVLREKYETTFGIYNHDAPDPKRPFALVAMHPQENSSAGSVLYERIDQFADRKVGKWFNLSLAEFLELPTDICRKILEASFRLMNEEEKASKDIMARLQNQTGGQG